MEENKESIDKIILEYENALQKSNNNVQNLKNKINELINENKILKLKNNLINNNNKYDEIIQENIYLKQEIEKLKNDQNIFEHKEKILINDKEELKKRLKKTKEDLKFELSEKIKLLRQLSELTHMNIIKKNNLNDENNNKNIDNLEDIDKNNYQDLINKYNNLLNELYEWKKIVNIISKHKLKENNYNLIDSLTIYIDENKEINEKSNEEKYNYIIETLINILIAEIIYK